MEIKHLRGAELVAFLKRVRIVDDPVDGGALTSEGARAELDHYVFLHRRSSQLCLEMLARHLGRAAHPRVLELGGAPYFFSALLDEAFGAELTAVNVSAGTWPGEPSTIAAARVTLSVPATGSEAHAHGAAAHDDDGPWTDDDRILADRELSIDVRILNVEKDPFPFADGTFDSVLCMEVLEHLGYSPSHMLGEVHRVLKTNGLLFLTVPNFINIKRTVNMLLNRRCQFPYSGYGIYGRHQREFAPDEVRDLLVASNFDVVELRTANVWPTFRGNLAVGLGNAALNALCRLPFGWIAAKREIILCAARTHGEAVATYPSWLYEHRHLYPTPPNGVTKVLVD